MLSLTTLTRLIATLSIISGVSTAPAPASVLAPLEGLPAVPQGWQQGDAVGASKVLRFRIAIKQENAFEFEQHLLAISTPDDPKYGQHMKRDELKAMLRPSHKASSAILSWLESQGVPSSHIEDDGDWINFFVPTVEAERILDTKFHYYSNKVADISRIRTLQYSVPVHLHQYIQMIQPTTRFGQILPQRSTIYEHFKIGPISQDSEHHYPEGQLNATFCNTTITPQCLRDLYHVGKFEGNAHNGKSIFCDSCPTACKLYRDCVIFVRNLRTY